MWEPYSGVPRAALSAACFLRPPGYYKRASLRETPHRSGAAAAAAAAAAGSLVKAAIRRRLKAARYNLLPPPRSIPVAAPAAGPKLLQDVRGVPTVSAAALQQRLAFLLSIKAQQQQQFAKLREGLTPYQAELFMWNRQLVEVRRIYRAQYLQRLREVTKEEQHKHYLLMQQTHADKKIRREEALQRLLDATKTRAMMHDRQQIDRKVTQAVQLGRVSRKKTANLLWLHKLQSAAHYQQAEKEALDEEGGPAPADTPEEQQRAAAAAQKKALKSIEERNVSATQILQHLGFCKEERKAPNKKITGTDDVFRQVLEESFALLPEDGPPRVNAAAAAGSKYGAAAAAIGRKRLSEKERARLQYAAFTDEEKLSLIDEKIKNITKEIDKQTQIRGIPKDLLLIQLRDHLEAAKQAYLEGKYIEETEKRMQQQQEQEKQQQQKEHQKLQQQEQQQEGTGDSKE